MDESRAITVACPGASAEPLDVLLKIDEQPEVMARFRADLAAVRDAERRADRYVIGVPPADS